MLLLSKGLNRVIGMKHILLYGYVECSCRAVRTACFIEVDRMCTQGRAKMTRKKLTENDCCEWKLRTASCSILGLLPSSMYQSSFIHT